VVWRENEFFDFLMYVQTTFELFFSSLSFSLERAAMSKRMFEEEHMAPRPCADGSYVQTGGTQGSIPGSPNMYCAGHAPGVGLAFDSIQVVVDDAQRYNIGDMKRVCPPPSDSVIEARFLVKKAEIGVIIGHKGTHSTSSHAVVSLSDKMLSSFPSCLTPQRLFFCSL
jgi:hypothetical protein